ncbi:hypothetical protein GC088_12690 [Arthrobacter sp. JZ12]|uniref:hypothetical protein n=1 Tax=Arthrobacter sp. JZ12 TaxID=2654190 RepID=UPI002B49522D|nr:hypothetical protein [Arthrobacter sp. JZ12]WRH25844.1 hypothetical protein GC088_12690 [Arthrobacter sp. JZ12]
MGVRRRLLALTVLCAFTLTACGSGQVAGTNGSDTVILLISESERDGKSGPEALFRGVLRVGDDNCLQGHALDGKVFNIEFPAGTHFNEAGALDMGFATVTIGDEISLGGGYSERPELTESLPESCRTGTTFRVYSA